MPEIYVYAVEGRTIDQKRALVKDITEAVVRNFKVKPEAVMVADHGELEGVQGQGRLPVQRQAAGLSRRLVCWTQTARQSAFARCRTSQRAVRSRRPSSPRAPMSCTPIGRPSASSSGSVTAGTPR